jgi:hypothetical protein
MDASSTESLLALAERLSPEMTGPSAKRSLEEAADRTIDLLAAIRWFVDDARTAMRS